MDICPEKPEHGAEYLVLSVDEESGYKYYTVAEWKSELTRDECRGPFGYMNEMDESGFYYSDSNMYLFPVDCVVYWWKLPK